MSRRGKQTPRSMYMNPFKFLASFADTFGQVSEANGDLRVAIKSAANEALEILETLGRSEEILRDLLGWISAAGISAEWLPPRAAEIREFSGLLKRWLNAREGEAAAYGVTPFPEDPDGPLMDDVCWGITEAESIRVEAQNRLHEFLSKAA